MSFTPEEKDFLSSASVRVIIPHKSNTNIETLQESTIEESPSLFDVEQRKELFFDEQLTVHVVLQIPECTEQQLQSYLLRLNLNLEIWAVSETEEASRPSGSSAPSRELVTTHHVAHDSDPILVVTQGNKDQAFLNLIWETFLIIQRPQIRMSDAYLTVHPTATIAQSEEAEDDHDILEPFQAQAANLFQPLQGAKGFEKEIPFLPMSRLQPVLPVPPKQDNSFHLHGTPSRRMKAYPAAITRLKFTRAHGYRAASTLLASLDIEVFPLADVKVTLNEIDMKLSNGRAHSLMEGFLPIECHSRDCVAFLYRLEVSSNPNKAFSVLNGDTQTLSIFVQLDLELPGGCRSVVLTKWSVAVDFSSSLSHQRPVSQTGQPSTASGYGTRASVISVNQQPVLDPTQSVSISFSAPVKTVTVGKPFRWHVLVVNKSARHVRLAIIPIPRMHKATTHVQNHARRHAPRISNASFTDTGRVRNTEATDIAPAFTDENVLYAMQHSGSLPSDMDIVSLTPELRVGPLSTNQCHEGEIEMVALKPGALMVDAVRVVDLGREAEEGVGAPGVIVDIRDLPDVIVRE